MTPFRSSGAAQCTVCGAVIGAGDGFLSGAGDNVCRRCFYAEQQTSMDGRAQEAIAEIAKAPGGLHSLAVARIDARSLDERARVPRQCAACASPSVAVVHVTAHFRSTIPLGRTYRHRCAACAKEFHSESVVRALTRVATAALLLLVGAGGLAGPPGARWLLVVGVLGLLLLGRTIWRAVQLRRNPAAAARS